MIANLEGQHGAPGRVTGRFARLGWMIEAVLADRGSKEDSLDRTRSSCIIDVATPVSSDGEGPDSLEQHTHLKGLFSCMILAVMKIQS